MTRKLTRSLIVALTVAMLAAPGVARRLAAGMADLDDSAKETV